MTAIDYAGLTPALSTNNFTYTIFAPSNDAFDGLLEFVSVQNLTDISTEVVTSVLLYHVVPGTFKASRLLKFPTGKKLDTLNSDAQALQVYPIAGQLIISGGKVDAEVVESDIQACSTIIHIIDKVLIPTP